MSFDCVAVATLLDGLTCHQLDLSVAVVLAYRTVWDT